jgi:L-serine dehydratase
MFLSVFDIFKIGIGPSSSHTVGPMVAARRFLELAQTKPLLSAAHLTVTLHGSLAFTGKGHGTDRAVILGLAGETPDSLDPDRVDDVLRAMSEVGRIDLADGRSLRFDSARGVIFDYGPSLRGHSNGMVFRIIDDGDKERLSETYYSIGGGFVQTETERDDALATGKLPDLGGEVPHPFRNAAEMLAMGRTSGLTIAAMKRANEEARMPGQDLAQGLDRIWRAMNGCMNRGLRHTGILPGGLKIKRRAADIHRRLEQERGNNAIQPHQLMDWLSVYAMAVNEENAAGGKVVTAPTNGAAGVIPATIRYYLDHCVGANGDGIRTFLLVAAAIGGLIKHNASISGAEVGCQGEVGSASAMAAAGLCAALGGSNEQIENAAEIALEHHLGMTCDPVKGLVQVPCIERNAFGAVKAVTAASLALRGDGTHFVPLDTCVETMRQTGLDMSERYKETSTGGLAVNVVEC